jgi:hypothetical protein
MAPLREKVLQISLFLGVQDGVHQGVILAPALSILELVCATAPNQARRLVEERAPAGPFGTPKSGREAGTTSTFGAQRSRFHAAWEQKSWK